MSMFTADTSPTTADRPSTADTVHPPPRPAIHTIGKLRVVPWLDPVADPLGVHPCSRYVEQYWLGILGPSTTWLLRRVSYGLEAHPEGFVLDLADTAHALGLGDRMGKNSPFRRALHRLAKFELARPHGPDGLAVRTRVPPLPLRHIQRLAPSLKESHRQWQADQRLSPFEQMRRRARRLALGLATSGHEQADIERRLCGWQFHPSLAFESARWAMDQHVPRTATTRAVASTDSEDRRD
ncbi:MAG: hypothetical protein QOJ44_1506 [Acidimicrobiaceae bacterium]|jgi:hypothetical protein|nr:hypothetical protein [Acidimicrobiaceae bacterium]